MSMLEQKGEAQPVGSLVAGERAALERDARRLAWLANAWHLVEFAIAVAAGIAAGSVALIAFGFDSLIELASGGVVIWLFSGGRGRSERAELRARQLVVACYALLVVYILVESIHTLAGEDHPQTSWVGIGLAAFTALTMPLLARAKRNVGRRLNSAATVGDAGQQMICAYLSVALLFGLLANALFGWWWADPVAALVIAAVAVEEAAEVGHGNDCC